VFDPCGAVTSLRLFIARCKKKYNAFAETDRILKEIMASAPDSPALDSVCLDPVSEKVEQIRQRLAAERARLLADCVYMKTLGFDAAIAVFEECVKEK